MLTCGVDIGARSIEVVLFDGSKIVSAVVRSSGITPQKIAEEAFENALQTAAVKRSDIGKIISTGYGRNRFKHADSASSEILCHAAGVGFYFPDCHTVVDIGGQDSKVIHVENGRVLNFAMNDRCAAGTGKFIEMVAQTLGVTIEECGPLSEKAHETVEISSMCAVFAESEIVGLLQNGATRETILRGVFKSVARRTVALMGRMAADGDVIFTGGVAKNSGVAAALKEETGRKIIIPPEPQITGALGAAIIAGKSL
jgi:predicted CoA-substrate-specific enzyme activase